MKEAEVVGDKGGRELFNKGEGRSEVEEGIYGRGEVFRESSLYGIFSISEVDVVKERPVGEGASGTGKGGKATVFFMVPPPEIDGGCVPMIGDEHVIAQANSWEGVVGAGGENQRGADCKEGYVEGVEVLEGGGETEEVACTDEGSIREGTTMEGGDGFANDFFNFGEDFHGEDKEEHMVSEE
jgi:hypothetical protein